MKLILTPEQMLAALWRGLAQTVFDEEFAGAYYIDRYDDCEMTEDHKCHLTIKQKRPERERNEEVSNVRQSGTGDQRR